MAQLPLQTGSSILALDVGHKRVGVALASAIARLAHPLTTLSHDESLWQELAEIVHREDVGCIVVGLPRNLNGDDTAQTAVARQFADDVRARFGLVVCLQDEALTSRKAEAELLQRGGNHAKGEIDALAATYILEDYLMEKHV
jgi:putative Holliday junction resolvase